MHGRLSRTHHDEHAFQIKVALAPNDVGQIKIQFEQAKEFRANPQRQRRLFFGGCRRPSQASRGGWISRDRG